MQQQLYICRKVTDNDGADWSFVFVQMQCDSRLQRLAGCLMNPRDTPVCACERLWVYFFKSGCGVLRVAWSVRDESEHA